MSGMREIIFREKETTIPEKAIHLVPFAELVRCVDCKWFHQAFENEGRCIKHDNDFHKPDWFCAGGERKEGR